MTLRLTNTLTRSLEAFQPLRPGQVSIYCCGVTVYDLCHLGHARSYINWDVLRRYLLWRGYAVTYVQNFTDIDDKILRTAAAEGSSMEVVSERNIAAYFQDMDALQILRPDGSWMDVSPPEGGLAVNVGDMLQRLTNHVLPSTTHRVVNPPVERRGTPRYSMPFFLHPAPDFLIKALPQCVSAENPEREPPITAHDYLAERLREIGLTKK